jgi:formamidopyrimidine-DNA glycosylase
VPELPEVETVVRGLRAVLPGKRILNVRLGKTDFIDDPAALELQLPGSKVSAVRRHGKFIVVELEAANGRKHESSLLIHLGMTGQILTCPPMMDANFVTRIFAASGEWPCSQIPRTKAFSASWGLIRWKQPKKNSAQ